MFAVTSGGAEGQRGQLIAILLLSAGGYKAGVHYFFGQFLSDLGRVDQVTCADAILPSRSVDEQDYDLTIRNVPF